MPTKHAIHIKTTRAAGACEQAVATATADDERVQWNVEDQDTALRHPPGLFASVLRRGQLPQQQQGSRAEWWVRWAPPIREPAWQDVARCDAMYTGRSWGTGIVCL
eukprot:355359-Chlamydomonas_euryale.AAC.5